MKQLTRLFLLSCIASLYVGCMGSDSAKTSTSNSTSTDTTPVITTSGATPTTATTTATATSGSGGTVTTGCISGDGTGSDGVFALTADASGGNRLSGDGETASGSGYTITGKQLWAMSKDSDISDKTILGDMDQGGTIEFIVQPQANPAGESLGSVTYCNTGANYTRLTMTVQLGKNKGGVFYPSDEHTYSAVSVDTCSSAVSFAVPAYTLSSTEYPDIVVKAVKSNGDCISYGSGCSTDPLVANKACWRTKVYVKMPYATGW